jgi:chromosome segregation ATPase
MAESELEKAFETLAEVLTVTESEISEEINVIAQQIEQLKERITLLHDKQATLSHDRSSIEEMYQRYSDSPNGNPVEF